MLSDLGNEIVFCKMLCKSSYSEYVQHSHYNFKYEINTSILLQWRAPT